MILLLASRVWDKDFVNKIKNTLNMEVRLINDTNNLEYKVIDVSTGPELRDEMIQKANGRRTIPQIFFNDEHIGGYQELRDLEKNGQLEASLK